MALEWLSVIIPSHNGERWLSAALQSIAAQKQEGIEVILVDSSSDTASLAIASSFSGGPKLQVFRRPDLVSWMAKTNFGVEQASGSHICMLHQDDLWLPSRCAALRNWIANAPDGVMHFHPCYFIDETDRRLGTWRCPLPTEETPVPQQVMYERLLVHNFIGIPAPAIRRDSYLAAGGLDQSLWYTADWDLYLKLVGLGTLYYHPEPLACFRIHKNSLTVSGSRDITDFRNQHAVIIRRYLNKVASEKRKRVFRMFNASVEVNIALAAAINGNYRWLTKAAGAVMGLGPWGLGRYVFCSRIIERVVPRLRAFAGGSF
jgi:glycosyltransferase involved in cell wall biosynthesis